MQVLLRRPRGKNHPEAQGLESIAKQRIELGQRVCSVFLILNGEIFAVAAYFTTSHLERFGIAHITWVQDVRIKCAGRLQLLHVLKTRKFKRILKSSCVWIRFTKNGEQIAEMFGR